MDLGFAHPPYFRIKWNYIFKTRGLTTCGHVKTFSPVIVSTDGSSNAHCLASGIIADTATNNMTFARSQVTTKIILIEKGNFKRQTLLRMGQYSNIHIVETRTKPKEKKKKHTNKCDKWSI